MDDAVAGKPFWSKPLPKKIHGSVEWGRVKLHIDTSGHVLNEAGVRCDLHGRETRARGCKGGSWKKASSHHDRRPRSTGFIT